MRKLKLILIKLKSILKNKEKRSPKRTPKLDEITFYTFAIIKLKISIPPVYIILLDIL